MTLAPPSAADRGAAALAVALRGALARRWAARWSAADVPDPARWAAVLPLALTYTVQAESDYDPGAVGDAGASLGLFQFFEPTGRALSVPWGWDWRASPLPSGWAAVEYAEDAARSPAWWSRLTAADDRTRLAAWRVLWRYGSRGWTQARQDRERQGVSVERIDRARSMLSRAAASPLVLR